MSEPYRDESETLRRRLDIVNTDLAEVKRRLDQSQALQQEQTDLETEVRELSERLARHQRRSLPLLDRIQVASPCDADWEAMRGDAHVRHCDQCDKHVYDLSSLTRPEAEALLQTHEGKLCVRYFRRADGTVLTADCPVGVARRRRRWLAFTALAVGSLAGVASLFVATATTGSPMLASPPAMGSFAAPVEPCSAPLPVEQGEPPRIEVRGEVEVKGGVDSAPTPAPSSRSMPGRPAGQPGAAGHRR